MIKHEASSELKRPVCKQYGARHGTCTLFTRCFDSLGLQTGIAALKPTNNVPSDLATTTPNCSNGIRIKDAEMLAIVLTHACACMCMCVRVSGESRLDRVSQSFLLSLGYLSSSLLITYYWMRLYLNHGIFPIVLTAVGRQQKRRRRDHVLYNAELLSIRKRSRLVEANPTGAAEV